MNVLDWSCIAWGLLGAGLEAFRFRKDRREHREAMKRIDEMRAAHNTEHGPGRSDATKAPSRGD